MVSPISSPFFLRNFQFQTAEVLFLHLRYINKLFFREQIRRFVDSGFGKMSDELITTRHFLSYKDCFISTDTTSY
jgi:hypothetical protein